MVEVGSGTTMGLLRFALTGQRERLSFLTLKVESESELGSSDD